MGEAGEHAGVPGGVEGGQKVRGTAAEWESWTGGGRHGKKKESRRYWRGGGGGGVPLFSLSVK